jgi:hypothetical protein
MLVMNALPRILNGLAKLLENIEAKDPFTSCRIRASTFAWMATLFSQLSQYRAGLVNRIAPFSLLGFRKKER